MRIQQAFAIGLMVCIFSGAAIAGNKPINGKYSCKGTASQSVLIGSVGGGTKSSAIKGRLQASRGRFLFFTTDKTWPAIIEGWIDPATQAVDLPAANETHKTMTTRDCAVMYMDQKGSGSQSKNGRKVSLSIEQTYSCGFSGSRRVDKYAVTCKR